MVIAKTAHFNIVCHKFTYLYVGWPHLLLLLSFIELISKLRFFLSTFFESILYTQFAYYALFAYTVHAYACKSIHIILRTRSDFIAKYSINALRANIFCAPLKCSRRIISAKQMHGKFYAIIATS